jgi:CheY-like chemotaxis protein
VSRNCVLVVDDDDLVRETMVELIQDYGCTATGAANGLQAIEVLLTSENRICLVFLDLAMPVMDGAAFREEQLKRAEIKDIPVVLMSAFGNLRNQSKQMQVEEYLQKPLSEAQIMDVVKRYCDCAQASA